MANWQKALIPSGSPILKAIEVIDAGEIQIALVVDEQRHLAGTITDGDIRRGILRGLKLDSPVESVMNSTPFVGTKEMGRNVILQLLRIHHLRQMPILNDALEVVDIEYYNNLVGTLKFENHVVLMAGGLGKRLGTLTHECPKPMLKIGGKPILEMIIDGFIEAGFYRFYISVNYHAEKVENYFEDGNKWGAQIEYIRETKPLGTAGALSMLPNMPEKTIIVMNGDLLTKLNYAHLLEFHKRQGAQATMCVREHPVEIPFGVVSIDDSSSIEKLEEKPIYTYFVNSGIYVLEPGTLKIIPKNTAYDMPEFFQNLQRQNLKTSAFPIREYWKDIGSQNIHFNICHCRRQVASGHCE